MELRNNPFNIFFSKEAHIYFDANGNELIGLTSLMSKHGLGADYHGIPAERLKKAAEEGTAIHEYLQSIDEGNSVFTDYLGDAYLAAIHEMGVKHLASEYLCSDNEIVATFIDKVYDTGELNLVDLADVKTTVECHKDALAWQLGVGKYLFELQNPGIKVRNCFCVWIEKKKRQLRDIVPIEPRSEEDVLALLECERSGRIYIDTKQTPGAELVLSNSELSTYVQNYGQVIEYKAKLKEAEEKLMELDGKVLKFLLDNSIEEMGGPDGITFKVKKAYTSTRVDSNAVKRDYPAVYEKCKTTSVTKASLLVNKKEQSNQ